MRCMNETRIAALRQDLGWTQERLATESGVGIRTIQRLEAGHDASLDTLARVSNALRVTVSDLFAVLDRRQFSDRVEALELRAGLQQRARDRITSHWLYLYIVIGVLATITSVAIGWWGGPVMIAYGVAGYFFLTALRNRVLEPRLDRSYPLSRRTNLLKQQTILPDGTEPSSASERADVPGPVQTLP